MSDANGQQLPQGWVKAELSEIAEIVMGQSPPSSTYNAKGDGLPFFQGKAEFGSLYPEARVWCSSPSKLAEKNDILLSVRAPVGPTNLAPARSCIGRGLSAVHPEFGVNLKYLLHAFRRFALELDAKGTGTTFKAVSGKVVRAFPIPIAPSAEQTRIANALDELLSDLDAGVAALERVQAKLKHYRAAVLKAAVEGALVPTAKPYPIRRIGDAIESLGQGWSPKCESLPSPDTETWAVIKTTAIQPLRYLEEHNKTLPTALKPRPHLELVEGDLLITRAGPRTRVGIACLVKQTRPRLMLCDKAYRLRCKKDTLSPAFLEVVLNAPHILAALDKLKTGINDSGLNLTQDRFAELLVPFPQPEEQEAIVEAVEDQLSVIEHLEADLEAKLKSAQALRQSILRHAFTGQLVPQDPKDEPAAELLKRIAAQREERARQAQAAKKTKPKAPPRSATKKPRKTTSHD